MFRFILQQQGTRTCCSSSAAIRLPRLTTSAPRTVTTDNSIYLQATAIPRLVDLGRLSSSSSTVSTTSTGKSVNDQLGKLIDLVGGLNGKFEGINKKFHGLENETKQRLDSMGKNFSRLKDETKQSVDSMNENFSRLESETKQRLDSMSRKFSRLENETKKDLASVKQNMTNLERKYEALESTTNAALEQEKRERLEHERQRDVRFKELEEESERQRDALFKHFDQSFKDLKTEIVDETKMYYEKSVIATSDSFRKRLLAAGAYLRMFFVAVVVTTFAIVVFMYHMHTLEPKMLWLEAALLEKLSLHRIGVECTSLRQKAELERQNAPAMERVKEAEGALNATTNTINGLLSSDLVSERVGENNKSHSESHCEAV